MSDLITSLQNRRIKEVIKLNNRRQRDARQVTLVEGVREVSRALANRLVPTAVYGCPDLMIDEAAQSLWAQLQAYTGQGQTEIFTVTPPVFARMAYRGDSGGFIVEMPYWQRPLDDLPFSANPFLGVIEGGEKPGNIGAILRSADAAGVEAIIVCDPAGKRGTDLFNPNTIRASLGAVFSVPNFSTTTADLIPWLRKQQISIAAALPEGGRLYTTADMNQPLALILGSEAFGLSAAWLEAADLHLAIPLKGQVNSLNLSVAAALLFYEVVRQRATGQTPGQA